MFPVKGLSISAEKLKVETGGGVTSDVPSAPKPSRKRKRQGNAQNVTAENFADLWQQVIEHNGPSPAGDKPKPKQDNKRQKTEEKRAKQEGSKPEGKKTKKDKKKEKRDSLPVADKPIEEDGDEWGGIDDDEEAPEAAEPVKTKGDKKNKKTKSDAEHQQTTEKNPKEEKAAPPAPPAAPAPATAKLTPLQASMREKLISARFRHLNETLYTRPSAEAFDLFQESPEMFTEYHEGFRRQVEVWPENPVDSYIEDIKARAKVRHPPRNRIANNQPVTPSMLPLPRPGAGPRDPPNPRATCTIADLGCGDAKLSAALQPLKQKLRLDLRSFDLQTGGSPLVTRADIANLPLADNSVDVAIFCLALMGTNWTDFVEEAYRVLRWRGELWIAEIKSRFAGAATANNKKVVDHSVGNRRKNAAPSNPNNKKSKRGGAAADSEDEETNLADLAVHVDGAEAARKGNETDISAFVEALRKRGFLLNRDLGDNAVDMGNKMFVKMHFVKAAPAVRGKCAAPEASVAGDGGRGGRGGFGGRDGRDGRGGFKDGGMMKQKKKFIGGDEEEDEAKKEARLLKPCVYKLR